MKTAIQLLDYYLSEKLSVNATEDLIESAKLDVYAEIGNLIGELLAKEKAQIVEAFKYAQVSHIMGDELRAEQYYHNVFKQQIEPNF